MATDELSAEEIHKLKQFSHALPDEQDKLDQLKNVDIDAIVDATGVSRRNVLQVILGLAAGGVVGGLSAQEIVQAVEADASTTDGDGNVGLPGDRVDLYADGIDATSLSTGRTNINNSVTMFVRSGGSDSNDGLSAGNAKATVQSAIEDAPVQRYDDWVVVDVDESATFNETITIQPYHPPVKIVGATDSGNPDTTFSAPAGNANLSVSSGTFRLENVKLEDADTVNRISESSHAIIDNCEAGTGYASIRIFTVTRESDLEVRNSTFDHGGNDFILGVVGANAQLVDSTFRSTGAGSPSTLMFSEDAGRIIAGSCTIDGRDSTSDNGIRSRENSHVKVYDSTFANLGIRGVQADEDGSAEVDGNITLNSVPNATGQTNGGMIIDQREAGNPTTKDLQHDLTLADTFLHFANEGTTKQRSEVREDENNAFTIQDTRFEQVGTSDTVIYSPSIGTNAFFGVVHGSDSTTQFVDVIAATLFGSVTVIGSNDRNAPASRTYGVNNGNIELSMGSGTYNVVVEGSGLKHT